MKSNQRFGRYVLIMSFVLLLAACSTQENECSMSGVPLHFVTEVVETRASSYTPDDNEKPLLSAGLWCYYTPSGTFVDHAPLAVPGYMYNEKLWRIAKNQPWGYENVKYWPTTGSLSFFAYAPYGVTGLTLSTQTEFGFPYLDFVQNNPVSLQEDLLGGSILDQVYSGSSVHLRMKHLLSRIGFSIKSGVDISDGSVSITVTGLRVFYSRNVARSGRYDYGTGTWVKTSDVFRYDAVSNADSIQLTTPEGIRIDRLNFNVFQPVNAPSQYLMMIPQHVALGDMTVSISYTIGSIHNELEIPLPALSWEPNKAYNYLITLSEGNADVVAFESDMDLVPWSVVSVSETVNLSSNILLSLANIRSGVSVLNAFRESTDIEKTMRFLLFGSGTISGSYSISLDALETGDFTNGDQLLLDFERGISDWDLNSTIKITGHNENSPWEIQTANYDPTGFTLRDIRIASELTDKGVFLLTRK